MRACLNCQQNLNLLGKNLKALYCSTSCKNKFRFSKNKEQELSKQKEYFKTEKGRAIRLYHGAFKRNPLFLDISMNWIYDKLKNGFCEVTGLPFSYEAKSPWAPSLDRIDSNLGYTKENTRIVIWLYNTAKNIYTDEDVLVVAQALCNANGSLKNQTSKREKR